MPPKPIVLIVPGAGSPAVMYKELANYLTSIGGYEVHVHDLLSASRCPPEEPVGLHEDADFFRSKLEDLCEAGKDVIVLCHSYGGLVATDAAHGLGKDKRAQEWLRGGIISIIYLTCIVGPVGKSSAEICKDVPKYDFMVPANEDATYLRQLPELSAAKVFSDLPHKQGLEWVGRMSMQSSQSFTDKTLHDSYRHISVTYILCTRDEILPPDFQRERIAFLRKATGSKVQTFELDAGHCPNASVPRETAELVHKAIGKARDP